MDLIKVLSAANRRYNPFYRNVIEMLPDAEHLEVSRLDLGAPHLATQRVSKILLHSDSVQFAIEHLQYDNYLLRSVMTGDELRVNVYEILPAPLRVEDSVTGAAILTGEQIRLEPFTHEGFVHHYLKRIVDDRWQLQGQVGTSQTLHGFYEPSRPTASWCIPLVNHEHPVLGIRS